jgi:prevent-host-death family protein
MNTSVTNISDAKAALSKLVERAERGERIIIGRAGKPVAVLIPWDERREPRQLSGSWRGRVWMAEDFDELPPELADAFGVREPE